MQHYVVYAELFSYHRYGYVVLYYELTRFDLELFAVRSFHGLTSFKLIISLTLRFAHFYYTTFPLFAILFYLLSHIIVTPTPHGTHIKRPMLT